MPDLEDLARLAPAVDEGLAGATFRRRRRRARAGRRLMRVVGVAVLVAGTSAAVLAAWDDGEPVITGPAGPAGGEVVFEVLAVGEGSAEMGTLRAATNPTAYAELWAASGATGAAPTVDLDRRVVVSVVIPDDACPPELTAFERVDDVITPVFVEPGGDCEKPLIPKTFVVALGRAALEPRFTLRLPADQLYGFGEQRLDVELGDPSALPVVWAQAPTTSQEGMGALVSGELSYDAELGCFQLGSESLRYPIVWPAGTVGVADGPGVRLPDGSVARVGDTVAGGGGFVSDPGFGIPPACAPTDEVATFNPNSEVTVTPAAAP